MLSFKEKISKNYINFRGWNTKEKYLIIESDDWGAVRMPSRDVYNELIENQIPVNKLSFDKHDSLESSEDLQQLFETLESVQDAQGHPAVLTAYHVVANPNFEAMEANGKAVYEYESILDTYARYKHTENSFALIKEGIKKGIYIPQSHGREHIHVKRYMEAINSLSEKEQLAFQYCAIISTASNTCKSPYLKNYFAGQDYSDESEFSEIETITVEGLDIFEDIFGYKSLSFTSQGSFCGSHLNSTLARKGVFLIGGRQFQPVINGKYKLCNKYWGQVNEYEQIFWRRNCMFEPSTNQDFDWVSKCLAEIEISFRWGKPAVISAHRENFIGSIFEENRTESLQKLETLLKKALKKWPDIQFISTHQLAQIMINTVK